MPDTGPCGLGQAANLGGCAVGRYIRVNGKSNPGDGALTIAAWFKTTNYGTTLTPIQGAGSGDEVTLEIVNGIPQVLLRESGSVPSDNQLASSSNLADGGWHHMAMTFTGGSEDTLRLFVDGKLSGVRTQSAGTWDLSGWDVGKRYGQTGEAAYYFDGSMDDVRMYDRALSDGGVSAVGQIAGGDVAER